MLLLPFPVLYSLILFLDLHLFPLLKLFVALTKIVGGYPIRAGTDLQPLAGLSSVHTPGPQLDVHSAQLHLETKL